MKLKLLIIGALLVGVHSGAYAGKVDDIVTAAKNSCGKDLQKAQAVQLVKKMFLTCKPGERVDIGGCQIGCMKSDGGAVVGSN
ncbi:MAG: hypothetical protein R2827_07415 [Bdellovibrionales bacterium]